MRVLLLGSAFSGLVQRVKTELVLLHHHIEEHYDLDEELLIAQVERFQPQVIICPFLTQKIPPEVWQNTLCLIVHPGIEGDRGPSSLDWAISMGEPEWGVTLLQADEEYDAGDIWGTRRFPMRSASKTSIYKREVTEAAVELIKQALIDLEKNTFSPRALDYDSPYVKGAARPLMRQTSRVIEWSETTTEMALKKLQAADSRPGVRAIINGHDVHLYGGIAEPELRGAPGDILAIHKGSFCCATSDGAVWIRQLKCSSCEGLAPIKLPASMVLEKICKPEQLHRIQREQSPLTPVAKARQVGGSVAEEIRVHRHGEIAYVYFDFYNGAMNTRQCLELKNTIAILKQEAVTMIVLMGGEDFFSNGIHLHCIEASDDPAQESWKNINAIDDLMLEIMNSPKQVVVAALRNNAGAGGAILALACDEVVIRSGVVLNPHYQSMGLYGSEYWTYLLPKRVGKNRAQEITTQCQPMLAEEAIDMAFADVIFDENWEAFHNQLFEYCQHLIKILDLDRYLADKVALQAKEQAIKPLQAYRNEELALMKKTFFDPASDYHAKRRAFVYGQKAKAPTPHTQAAVAPAMAQKA